MIPISKLIEKKYPSSPSKVYLNIIYISYFLIIWDHVILAIACINNYSITNYTVPYDFKVAKITPIHYINRDETDFTYYKPTLLVGIIAIILQKIIKTNYYNI